MNVQDSKEAELSSEARNTTDRYQNEEESPQAKLLGSEAQEDELLSTSRPEDWASAEFFICDEAAGDQQHTHSEDWNWRRFGIFFLLHLLYFFALGPLLIIPCLTDRRTINLYFNMYFQVSFQASSLVQFSIFAAFQVILWAKVFGNVNAITTFDIVYVLLLMIVRSLVIAGKYASFSDHQMEQILEKRLLPDEVSNEFFTHFVTAEKDIFVREVSKSLIRENVDQSMFYLQFYFPLDVKTAALIKQEEPGLKEAYARLAPLCKVEQQFPPETKQKSGSHYSGYFQIWIKLYSQLNINEVSRGLRLYSILYELNRRFCETDNSKRYFTTALLFCCISHHQGFGSNPLETSAQVMIYYINIILGTTNFYVFLMGIRKLNRKDYLLAQAGYMISIQKSRSQVTMYPKVYPTLNILSPATLRSWVQLRTLIMDFGLGYRQRYQKQLVWFFFWFLIQVGLLFTNALTNVRFQPFESQVNIYDVIVLLSIVYYVLNYIASINDQFSTHKTQISYQIEILTNIKAQHEQYFDESYTSKSQVYLELRNRLQVLNKEDPAAIPDFIDNINSELAAMQDSLQLYDDAKPYTILGQRIDSAVLLTMQLGFIATVLPSIIQVIKAQVDSRNTTS